MSATDWLVVAGAAAAIAWVNWYFFVAGASAVGASAVERGGVQEVRIVVSGGYSPSTVRVRPGERARLVFDRRERSGCSEEVVIAEFGVRKYLPAFEETAVELTPTERGSYEFTCGMGMLRGRIVVE